MSKLIVAASFAGLRAILLLGVVALSEILIEEFPLLDEAAPLKHYLGQYRMLIAVNLLVSDLSEPIEDPLLQSTVIVIVCDLVEFVTLRLHHPSLVEFLDHCVQVSALYHTMDLLYSFFVHHTLAK